MAWKSSKDGEIKIFELNIAKYGTVSAHFLAMCTLKALADKERKYFSK